MGSIRAFLLLTCGFLPLMTEVREKEVLELNMNLFCYNGNGTYLRGGETEFWRVPSEKQPWALLPVPSGCVFPFSYKDKSYFACTKDYNNEMMCATKVNHLTDVIKWGPCHNLEGPWQGSSKCAFPFVYKGETFYSCTTKGTWFWYFWCATTRYYRHRKWEYCPSNAPFRCVFPFYYYGKLYESCTYDHYRYYWCATAVKQKSKTMTNWRDCMMTEYGGNDNGRSCVFPFVYKRQTFHTCTNKDSVYGIYWCATTRNFDRDRKWSFCADTRVQPAVSYKSQ